MAIVDWLATPLSYGFMQRGMLASVMVGVLCAVVGCYIVLRSMAFLGDALAHGILPGVAIAYLLQGNLMVGALVAAIGILFAASLSLGVLLISTIRTYAVDLTHILFGNVLGVSTSDLWLTAGLGLVVLVTITLLYKEFLVISFDPIHAATLRLPAGLLRNVLLVLLALTIVVSLQTVGVGLVAAMLVTPSATAYLLTRRLPTMMGLSAAVGAFSSIAGLYISFYFNVASGAAVVLTATGVFLLAFMFAPRRGVMWQYWRTRRSAER
jgi:ABC-type Mn2+/Zn2+ transport system permease subunit